MDGSSTVAIVGRPNVGKSALFNRLAGRRIAIVHDQPGITRDRITAVCRIGEKTFTLVDTGGIGSNVDADFAEQIRAEAHVAMATADVIIFLVDAQSGLTPVDEELAQQLRRSHKHVLLVVNKIDHPKHEALAAEFERLGFKSVVAVSAEHGRGIDELRETLSNLLPESKQTEDAKETLSLAVVGRPNVGKSSLINAILQDNRTLVSEIAGTTRDAIDVPYLREGRNYVLIDTAGIRHRGKHRTSVEVFSVMRAERSIRRADLCVLVIDATQGVTSQDKKIAGLIQKAAKPCIVVANKWDLIVRTTKHRQFIARLREELFFIDYAPIVLLSAKTGRNMAGLFEEIDEVRTAATQKIGTGELNRLIRSAVAAQPPAARGGRRLNILYETQVESDEKGGIRPPAFVFFVNDATLLSATYKKYLEATIRKREPFTGLPLIFKMRAREGRS
jgi:GTPase